jgi:hypothetical protein
MGWDGISLHNDPTQVVRAVYYMILCPHRNAVASSTRTVTLSNVLGLSSHGFEPTGSEPTFRRHLGRHSVMYLLDLIRQIVQTMLFGIFGILDNCIWNTILWVRSNQRDAVIMVQGRSCRLSHTDMVIHIYTLHVHDIHSLLSMQAAYHNTSALHLVTPL